MICPKCGTEYREGFYQCADCGIALVWPGRQPDEDAAEPEEGDLEQVLDSQDSGFMSDVIAAVEKAEIPYLLESGTAFEFSRKIIGRRSLPAWRACLYVPAQFTDQFDEILDQLRSRPVADESSTNCPE